MISRYTHARTRLHAQKGWTAQGSAARGRDTAHQLVATAARAASTGDPAAKKATSRTWESALFYGNEKNKSRGRQRGLSSSAAILTRLSGGGSNGRKPSASSGKPRGSGAPSGKRRPAPPEDDSFDDDEYYDEEEEEYGVQGGTRGGEWSGDG